MRTFKNWLIALLITLLVFPLAAIAAQATGTDSSWSIVKYETEYTIYKDDAVDITVWLAGSNQISEKDVIPVVGSFNGTSVKSVKPDDQYQKVVFEDARYMGVGNTFSFRVGGEILSLTIHECEEYTEQETEDTDQTAPVLQVGRHDQSKAIARGETQTLTLWVHNLTEHHLEDVVATVTPSADLQIADNSVTYPLGRIWDQDVAFFDVTVRSFGEISTAAQSLTVDVSYTYEKNGAMVQGTASQTVPLSAVASQQTDGMTASVPNVIISGYDYGSEKISAGTSFDLGLEFKNTSASRQVENIVMTIDPGTALAITSSSNSFHFASLAAGGTQSQTINLQALPDAPSAPAVITVKFNYEYVDNNERKTVSGEQTLSLPVYQLDRFELTQDMSYVEAWQFEESFLTLSYINKGKGTVYNVSAELRGDVSAMSKVQNVGNVEAGKSGTIDFIITPDMAGETSCTLVVTYEDDAMQVMTKEFEFTVHVNEAYVPEIMPEEVIVEEEPSAGAGWVLPAICVAVAAAVILVIVLRVRKKKKSGVVDTFVFTDGTEDTDGLS